MATSSTTFKIDGVRIAVEGCVNTHFNFIAIAIEVSSLCPCNLDMQEDIGTHY